MKFEIKHKLSGAMLFECDVASWKLAIELAISKNADLSYADLSYADLSYANLSSANLRYADLSSADLSSADLRSADLSSANFRYANLRYANLRYADLSSADLSDTKKDFLERLSKAKDEVKGLYDYLMKGKINGTSYEGDCACFCGTIANIRKENYKEMSIDLRPDSSSPTEIFFMTIQKGDLPQSNPVADIVRTWIEEFAKENSIKLPRYEIVAIDD